MKSNSKLSTLIKTIGIMEIVFGFLLGILLVPSEKVSPYMKEPFLISSITFINTGIIAGTITIALAEIIKLLNRISFNKKDNDSI